MKIKTSLCLILLTAGLAGCATDGGKSESAALNGLVTKDAYARAELFLTGNLSKSVHNNDLQHRWIPGTGKLWYKKTSQEGNKYIVADPASGEKYPAFDHASMAEALETVLEGDIDPSNLPVQTLIFMPNAKTPVVVANGKILKCDLDEVSCKAEAAPGAGGPPVNPRLPSPHGKYEVFIKDYNLWVKDLETRDERALTEDGNYDYQYGRYPESSTSEITLRRMGLSLPPIGVFSPDGSKFLTYRLDQSRVKSLYLLENVPEDGTLRPKIHEYRYPFPGEAKPLAELHVFDLETGTGIRIDHEPLEADYSDPISKQFVSWGPEGRKVYIIAHEDGKRVLTYSVADAGTGKTKRLVTDKSDVFNLPYAIVGQKPLVETLRNGDFIWTSEKTGWRHLYLHDGKTGELKHPITSGDWMVREIVRIDEADGVIYFTASGHSDLSDPYFRRLYSTNLDGTGLHLLTPEDADHEIRIPASPVARMLQPMAPGPDGAGFSPAGDYFVDSYSRPDAPTVTVVRDASGKRVMELETATLSGVVAEDFRMPETFRVLAADGKTPIYGTLFKPGDFDPAKSYPVIDSIYPGPQINRVSKRFMTDPMQAQAVAELGFIVITVDGRGTPLRGREFRDPSYGNLGTAGSLDDHIAAIRRLGESRPYMDLDRVGIYGSSGGGFATVRALFDYPDFYKVGVASAGNHDHRIYISLWGETYQGPYDEDGYLNATSYKNVADFKGKLLIAHGEMDDNVHPANSMRVIDQLIRHNKTFDMLILPNVNHGILGNPYFTRRLWDYFVTNLKGATPPADYQVGAPMQKAAQ
jgi:dipeptidyl aminopeptidase/acylaminoacyl peptidase